jgi:hypothetical protein
MFVGKYAANRSVTAQAVRGFSLPTGLYDYFYPAGGLRRSAPALKNRNGLRKFYLLL